MITWMSNKLKGVFGDKETRHALVAEYIATTIPFQIHELRESQGGMTQKELAKKAGMAQERISVLEDPNYGFLPKISTLQRLAEVFDVPLIVRFGTWSELLDWQLSLSPVALAPLSYEQEVKASQAPGTFQMSSGQFIGGAASITYYDNLPTLVWRHNFGKPITAQDPHLLADKVMYSGAEYLVGHLPQRPDKSVTDFVGRDGVINKTEKMLPFLN